MANEGFTKLRNGLYMDNRTKKIGKLLPTGRGGFYVEDIIETPKKISRMFQRGKAKIAIYEDGTIDADAYLTKGMEDKNKIGRETREQYQKWKNAWHYGHNREYYKKITDEWAEKGSNAKNVNDYNFARSQRDAWRKNYEDTVKQEEDFNKVYNNPKEYKGDLGKIAGKHVNRIDTNSLDIDGLREKESADYSLKEIRKEKEEKAIDRVNKRYAKELQKEYDRISYENKERQENNEKEKIGYSEISTRVGKNQEIADKIIEDEEWNDVTTNYYGGTNATIKNERTGKVINITPSDTEESLRNKIESSYKEDTIKPYYNEKTKRMLSQKVTTAKEAVDNYYKRQEKERKINEQILANQSAGEQHRQLIEEMGIKTFADEIKQESYTKTGNLRYKAFGIERTPEDDFSDDGTRFTAYRLPNGMEMTVAKDNEDIYLSLDHPYHKEVSYEEYSNLPHYKDLDRYNGVRKDSVDLNEVIKASENYMNEYNELLKKKGIKPEVRTNKELRLDSIRRQIEWNNKSIEYYNNKKDYSNWRYDMQQKNRLAKKNERLRKELEKLGG